MEKYYFCFYVFDDGRQVEKKKLEQSIHQFSQSCFDAEQ